MAEDAAPAAPASEPTSAPWYQGKADAEIVGHWQNRALDHSDPANVAIEMTKAYRELEKFRGVPASRLVTLPENLADPAALRPIYERLGAPKDAKDYDFSLKYSDGEALEAELANHLRPVFHERGVPKDTATEITKAIMKDAEARATTEAAQKATKRADEESRLAAMWGNKVQENMLRAGEGARRAGVSREQLLALEDVLGVDAAAELFRRFGDFTSEDSMRGGGTPHGDPPTVEAAKAQLADLKADKEWGKRFTAGGKTEKDQFRRLMAQITGVNEAAELANL